MRFLTPVRAALALALAAPLASLAAEQAQAPAPHDIRPDPAAPGRVWDGWGVSLCWWAKVYGDRDDIADAVFTTKTVRVEQTEVPGLGLNIARYNAGACSWNEIDGRKMVVSKHILPFRQIDSFWLDPRSSDPESSSWNWNADANQRAMLLKARDRAADRFELFSNSPPWWMCANDNPSGAADKHAENLRPDQHENFAVYLASIARRAKDRWGVAFTTIEAFNEPISGYWTQTGKQEGSYFSSKVQAAFLPVLRAALDKQGLADTPIAASDETSYTHGLKTWNSFDASAKALVHQVNVHGYEGGKGPRRELHEAVVVRDGKPLWNTEYGDKQGDGLLMARCIHLDFQDLRPTAWSYWQAVDGGINGVGGSGWGLFDARMLDGAKLGVNPKYFVLAQYTRHLRPGMTVLESGDARTIAAYSAAERKLVLIAFNDGPAARATRFDLSAFSVPDQKVASWLTSPKAEARYAPQAPLKLAGRRFEPTLPADSIQTFELRDVTLSRSKASAPFSRQGAPARR